jgi:hypothetical protein
MHIDDETAIAAYPVYWHDRTDHLLGRVPDYMRGAFCRWVLWGVKPGDFLYAVARSDLFQAVRHGDEENQSALVGWVKLFYNGAPAACFGSDRLAERWREQGGLLGRCADCGEPLDVPGVEATKKNEVDGAKVCKRCCEDRVNQKFASQILGG